MPVLLSYMPVLLIVGGLSLIGFMLFDALWTTIAPHGAGPLSKRIARNWWTASLWVHRRRAGGAYGLRAFAGPPSSSSPLRVGGLLWAGWSSLFSAEPAAVTASSSDGPTDLTGRVYYVGFVLFSLGSVT